MDVKLVPVLASDARIASVNSEWIREAAQFDECLLFWRVTAKTGSPTSIDAAVAYSVDGGSTFIAPNTAETFVIDSTGSSSQLIKLSQMGEGFRLECAMVGGSVGNGFTFQCDAVFRRLRR